LSTSAVLADLSPSWKEEVNRRLAAHLSRKGSSAAETKTRQDSVPGMHSRAAEAAARVAARYAKAPSYSEMLANEARAAVRAAEAASKAALEAQAAAESILAGLEAGNVPESHWEPEPSRFAPPERVAEEHHEAAVEIDTPPTVTNIAQPAENQSFAIRWDADLPARAPAPEALRETRGPGVFESSAEEWWQSAAERQESPAQSEAIEVVEPARPIRANLIEFPRELVATRKIRPRLADGPNARAGNAVGQLNIFEVDPATISTEPAVSAPAAEAAPAWPGADWSSIRLDEAIAEEHLEELEAQEESSPAIALEPAPINLRLMAAVVDGAFIVAAFSALAIAAMSKASYLPSLRQAEIVSAAVLALLTALYQFFFISVASSTPGMMWARIAMFTHGGEKPTFDQRCGRLGALVMSLLPVGLGAAWAIFDDEHLCWHDRLSGTYLRKR
jgi:uncharacterized RDD family membrane protein YckC